MSLSHVVYTRDITGNARIYIDGIEQANGTVEGDFSSWYQNHLFGLANEVTGDRPWLGELYLVAVYTRALSSGEVMQNFDAGPGASTNQVPSAAFTADPVAGDAPLPVAFDAVGSF